MACHCARFTTPWKPTASFSGGFIEHRSERYTVRGVGLATNENDLKQIVVSSAEGVPVLVGDVASVELGAMPRQGAVTRDGKGETVAGMVIMLKGESGKVVADRVKSRMADIAASCRRSLKLLRFYDQTEVIDRTSATVKKNLVEGSLLVVVVLFVFLRNVRAALITAVIIPLSMLVGFIGMKLFGVSANLMSLGAIDFGLLVDGAVVMIENFVRRGHEPDHGPPDESAHHGAIRRATSAATEVARPILFGVLIIIAVYIPIFALEGLEGKMFKPMAITVCSALLGSLLLSLTAVPVFASYFLKPHQEHEEKWFAALRHRYGRHLHDAMNHKGRTLAVALVAVSAALASVPFLGTEFMPKLDEGSILIETRKLPSVSLQESVALSTEVEKVVKSFPEVKTVVTKIGRPDVATEAMSIFQGDVYVILYPVDEWTSGRTKDSLIEALAVELEKVPGLAFNFTQPMAMRLDEVVSGVKADVAVKIFGPDATVLERLGEQVRQVLERVQGNADLQVEVLSGSTQIQLDIDRARIARYGLNVTDVREVVETAVGGMEASEVLDGARRFPVVVRYPEALRSDATAIAGLMLTGPAGERVPMSSVAKVREIQGPEAINHESAERRLVVQTNVRGRDMGSFVTEGQRAVADRVQLPAGYHLEWGGQFENQQRAMRRLTIVIPLSLAIIFLLLFVTFGKVRQAGLVIMNVPFALVGGIAALWLRQLNLNLSASVGFIALFGVAVLNGVVLVSAVNKLREEGTGLRHAIVSGASTRLKPVLMTATVAMFGFFPMALSHGAGAEISRPLATVVIGGIITSTLLTLIVLPTLYELIEARVAGDGDA
ncbi:MAG: CusA/CzcA family heavy metal efflux RND transporter [Vicinamibacterales bacterium]